MKKHTNLIKEIYKGKKPTLSWLPEAIGMVVLIAVSWIVFNVVTLYGVATNILK